MKNTRRNIRANQERLGGEIIGTESGSRECKIPTCCDPCRVCPAELVESEGDILCHHELVGACMITDMFLPTSTFWFSVHGFTVGPNSFGDSQVWSGCEDEPGYVLGNAAPHTAKSFSQRSHRWERAQLATCSDDG